MTKPMSLYDSAPFKPKMVLLSLLTIVVCGLVGWFGALAFDRVDGLGAGKIADHTWHRPDRPALPTSPFVSP